MGLLGIILESRITVGVFLLVLVSCFSWNDRTTLYSYFMGMHVVQFILDSRISGRFLSSCTELLNEGISERNLLERRCYWDGFKSAYVGRPGVHEQYIIRAVVFADSIQNQ